MLLVSAVGVLKSDPLCVLSSLAGVQVNEDLQSSEVGPTLHRAALSGSDTAGESRLGLLLS